MVRDARPDRAGAGYDDSSHVSSSARSSGVSVRSGARTSSRIATPRWPRQIFSGRLEREALEHRAHLRDVARAIPHEPGHELREGRRQAGDRPGRSALEALEDERLGPDEDVEPFDQERLDRLERLVRDLEPGEVRRELAQPLDRAERDRVAAARAKLVEVEGERVAGLGRRGEMPNERLLVERVVRRPDDRDGIRALPGGIRRELHGVGRRLRAAVDGHVEAVAAPPR